MDAPHHEFEFEIETNLYVDNILEPGIVFGPEIIIDFENNPQEDNDYTEMPPLEWPEAETIADQPSPRSPSYTPPPISSTSPQQQQMMHSDRVAQFTQEQRQIRDMHFPPVQGVHNSESTNESFEVIEVQTESSEELDREFVDDYWQSSAGHGSNIGEASITRIKSESAFRLTPEFYEKEKEITSKWLNKLIPTIINREGVANKASWTWFRDWLSHHSRFSHKLAIMTSNATIEKRMDTFKTFPKNTQLSIDKIVRAGFFYLNYGTSCKCFCCGGVIGNWEKDDEPFSIHALFYPNCEFVMLEKGGDFIIKTSYEYRLKKEGNIKINVENKSISGQSSDSERSEQMKDIDDAVACIVCLSNKINVTYIPCGHTVCCSICTLKVKSCVSCRIPIKAALKIFLP